MKNPTRLLCTAIVGLHLPKARLARPLMAAGGLCAAAALVFVWAAGSPERATVEQAEAAHPSGEKTSRPQPNSRARTTDPARALTHAFTLGDRERKSRVRDLLSAWATRDAEAALSWASSLEDSAARRSARSTICFALAEEDPRRAVVLALAHGADEDDNDLGLLECLTMQWCEKECATVVDWAREQPPGEWRERLLARVSFVLSKSDPTAAAHVVSGLEPGTVQDEAAMAVLHQWALQDSAAALRWAEAFPESTLRDRALAEISNLRNLASSLHAIN